ERRPHRHAESHPLGWMEAHEINAVVEDRDPRRWNAVVRDDLVADTSRDGENPAVARRSQRSRFEAEDGAVIGSAERRAKPGRFHAREIAPVRSAADAHDVLPGRAAETDNNVPLLTRDRPRRHGGERQEAREPAGVERRYTADARARKLH